MKSLTLLRRLAEQHNYSALHDACLEAGPDEPAVQVLLALAKVHLGDASAGIQALASIDGETFSVDVRVDLAALHIGLGEPDRAIAILETARHECPDHALLLARLGWCRLQKGQHADALTLYEKSLRLRPLLAVHLNLLRLYRDEGRLADMATCLEATWLFWAEAQTDWPEGQRQIHSQQLRSMQLDLWLARQQIEAAETWIEHQRDTLSEDDWCALLSSWAQRLSARDHHAQAEEWLRRGLTHYPENLALYGRLAELAQLQGRSLQAIALLRRALRVARTQDSATVPLWIQLSTSALQANPRLAREAAERAGEQLARLTEQNLGNPRDLAEWGVNVELALAEVEAMEQDYQAAERRYQQMLDQRPNLITALQGLGQICMQLGQIDQAVGLFERVKAIDPTRGYGALIAIRHFPEDEATLQRLEELARKPSREGSVHTGLLFQLAAAWEKREDYERAFALATEANAASRRLLRYDPESHRQRSARIRHAFPRSLYEHRSACGLSTNLPVFVVGMPRSGTTLVEQIIAGHSQIHGAGELGTIPRIIAGLERWERHSGSGRTYPDCVDDLDPAVTNGIAENVLKELRDYAPDAHHVVDKLPHNFENIGLIRFLFPRAKIISVRRDPRDIAISNYFTDYAGKHGGMGFAYDLEWIGEQLADHNLLMHHWQQVFPGGILEVQYEDLVDDPETSTRRMLDYIGVDWEPQVLDFHALDRPIKTASVWQVRQPLYTSSKGKWQRYQQHLTPLITGTNRKITWAPIEMVTLPEPGWLNSGVDYFRQGDLDAAENQFKRLLHHVPQHAAASFMLGLVFTNKGLSSDGIPRMEQALERCPWNLHWRNDLAQAYRLEGRDQDAAALTNGRKDRTASPPESRTEDDPFSHLDYLFLSGESTCSSTESATSVANY